jgi:hypothetical protein
MGASKLMIFGGRRLGPEPAALLPSHAQAEKMSIGSCNACDRKARPFNSMERSPGFLHCDMTQCLLLFAVPGC